MRFAAGEYSLLLIVLPILALVLWAMMRKRAARLKRLAEPALAELLTAQVSDRKVVLKTACLFLGLLLLILALTRPQIGGRSTLVKREGIDLLFALDVSRSMAVKDIRPSRLRRAKLELQALIDQLSGDRVGLVSFAGAAFMQSPLTSDYAAARMFLKSASSADVPVQGTAIGDALELSHKLLTGDEGVSGSRLVVLLTDGEDHGEKLDGALEKLAADKIPVFVVGIGSSSGEPIPEYGDDGNMAGYHRDKDGKTVMSRLNESVLRRIADKTGGRYVSLQAGGSLDELKDYVSTMQKLQFESALYTQYDEQFQWLLWPAFLLLLAAAWIDERRGSRWLGVRA